MIFRVHVTNKEPEGVILIDRDGTLIEDNGYLSDPAGVIPIGNAVKSLEVIKNTGCALFLISNQAGLAKGRIRGEEFDRVRRRFEAIFDPRGTIFDGIFYCPHHVEGIVRGLKRECPCRKPGNLMVETALSLLRKVPGPDKIFTIGDKTIDIMVGKKNGFQAILVETGYGSEDKDKIEDPFMMPDYLVRDFDEAVSILSERI